MTIATTLSLGGLFVGLAIIVWHLSRWWVKGGGGKAAKGAKGDAPAAGRNPRDLVPFVGSLAFGQLAGSCTGGVLGIVTGWITGLSNAAGDKAMAGMTGTTTPPATHGHIAALNPGGALVTMLALVLALALWKKIGKRIRAQLGAGFWAGSLLALAAGVAGLANATLIPVVNTVGGVLYGAVAT